MIPTYSPLEKLHLKLAKWHLRKLAKVDKEILDKLWLECYNSIIKEQLEYPFVKWTLTKEEENRIIERLNKISEVYPVTSEEIGKALHKTAETWKNYNTWGIDCCNAIVKLKGDEDELST
jgi:hypothetical protein